MQPAHAKPDTPTTNSPHFQDEIDLRQLVRTLWQYRMLILGIALLGVLLGVLASLRSAAYKSESLFLTPGVSASNFKRYEAVLSNGPRLGQFLTMNGNSGSQDSKWIQELVDNPGAINTALKPEFAFTDTDQKIFGVKVSEDDPGAMIGIRIQYSHSDSPSGEPVELLAEYVRDTIIRVNMESTLLAGCTTHRSRAQELRNQQLQSEFDIRQQESRASTLRTLIARQPETNGADIRQLVSLDKGGERYLSPAAQLIAVEILIADMKLAEAGRERERIASALKGDYYCQAQQAMTGQITGRQILSQLSGIQLAVFQNQDKSTDIIEQTWNEIDIQRQNWNTNYLSNMRFVAPPQGSETKQRKTGLALGAILGGVLGGMLGLMLALILGWWRGEHNEVSPPT